MKVRCVDPEIQPYLFYCTAPVIYDLWTFSKYLLYSVHQQASKVFWKSHLLSHRYFNSMCEVWIHTKRKLIETTRSFIFVPILHSMEYSLLPSMHSEEKLSLSDLFKIQSKTFIRLILALNFISWWNGPGIPTSETFQRLPRPGWSSAIKLDDVALPLADSPQPWENPFT